MARDVNLKVRLTEAELAALGRIGARMSTERSGIKNPDGSINTSAVVRRLIAEDRRA